MSLPFFAALTLSLAAAPAPSPTQEALYKALLPRDGGPPCAELAALSPTLVEDLVFITENARQPAYVGVRAGACLLEDHAEAAQPVILGWLSRPEAKGFALLTVEHLDRLPLERARTFAEAGLKGPMAEVLRPRIARLSRPELAALAVPAPAAVQP
jgi:hypothetical protein